MRLINADAAIKDANLNWGGVYDAVMLKRFLDSQPSVSLGDMTLEELIALDTPKPNDDPLTLVQLLEMNGKPVWLVGVSSINGFRGHWDICEWVDGKTVTFPHCGESPDLNLLGKTWFVYRCEPDAIRGTSPAGPTEQPLDALELAKLAIAMRELEKYHDLGPVDELRLMAEKMRENGPMTPEELKEWAGPIWVCYRQETHGTQPASGEDIPCSRYKFSRGTYGETWVAFRHKPAGVMEPGKETKEDKNAVD